MEYHIFLNKVHNIKQIKKQLNEKILVYTGTISAEYFFVELFTAK